MDKVKKISSFLNIFEEFLDVGFYFFEEVEDSFFKI